MYSILEAAYVPGTVYQEPSCLYNCTNKFESFDTFTPCQLQTKVT